MKISAPTISYQNGRHVLSARISVEDTGAVFPNTLWFTIDTEQPPFEPGLADAFVVGLVAVAMKLGEDIHVEGRVSSRLAYGLGTYQVILNTWWPEFFSLVDINYAQLDDRQSDMRPESVCCSFSGGLDSYHAVMESLPSRLPNPAFNLTHALMINGFDQIVDLEHRGLARQMYNIYHPILAELGVELLMIDTNLKQFRDAAMSRLEVVNSYSSSLAASAHALAGLFGRFSIPGFGNYAWNELEPDGSHPVLDHHMSSDQLQIIHAGSSYSRIEKLQIVADMPLVQKSLRVCFLVPQFDPHSGKVVNCGECEKCVRTIVGLEIMGKLDKFTTFSRLHPIAQYQRPDILFNINDMFLKSLQELAQQYDRSDWEEALRTARELRDRARPAEIKI